MNTTFEIYIYNQNSLTEKVKNELSSYFSKIFSEEDDLYIIITYLDGWTIQFSTTALQDKKDLELIILEKLAFNDNNSENPLQDYQYMIDKNKKNTIPESLFHETKTYVAKLWGRFSGVVKGWFDKK